MTIRLFASIALTVILANCATTDQNNPIGDWSGTLNLGGNNLRLIFHITESETGYSTTIESVDQNGVIIPTEMEVNGDSLIFRVDQLNVEYTATISGNQIVGEFNQFGLSMPDFTITRNE